MRIMFVMFAILFSSACGESPGSPMGSTDLGGVPGDALPGDALLGTSTDLAVAAGYPAGPYGNNVGDTFPPLLWEGYVDDAADAVATTKPYGTYSADAARKSGRAYAMVHVAEFT